MTKRRPNAFQSDVEDEKYDAIAQLDGSRDVMRAENLKSARNVIRRRAWTPAVVISVTVAVLILLLYHFLGLGRHDCSNWKNGYWCDPDISHFWGQYSPYFNVRNAKEWKELENEPKHGSVPHGCSVTMVSLLSRHGARAPTLNKSQRYNVTINKVKGLLNSSTVNSPKYRYLRKYEYGFETDQLNDFGRKQLNDSGKQFYKRYAALIHDHLTNGYIPFIRAGSQERVYESAQAWINGFQNTKETDNMLENLLVQYGLWHAPKPYPILPIDECDSCNNTLHHSRCTAHESGRYSYLDEVAQTEFAQTFVPAIARRLNEDLEVESSWNIVNTTDVINLMQLCAFDTVNKANGSPLSPFCDLFSPSEFQDLDYYETLDKYYSYGGGNPLGPTQGVGWANELLARLTNTDVRDHTSTNRTLDSDPSTFPLPRSGKGTQIYADFSHDNDMVAALWALRLFEDVPELSTKWRMNISETGGFSSAWVCPFAARVYVEKLSCDYHSVQSSKRRSYPPKIARRGQVPLSTNSDDNSSDFVRIIVNDRVMPMPFCESDEEYGLCKLDDFVAAQDFARSGGRWTECFEDDDDIGDDGRADERAVLMAEERV